MEPRSFRNFNYGNIIDSPFARSQPGYVGSDGRFAIFDSPQSGMGAMDNLLAGYGRRGINTVEGVINRWAPPVENNTGAYASFVTGKMGLQPGAMIDLSDPGVRQALGRHIAHYESGKPLPDNMGSGPPAAQPQAAPASYGALTPPVMEEPVQAARPQAQPNPMLRMALGALNQRHEEPPPVPLLLPPAVRRPAPWRMT